MKKQRKAETAWLHPVQRGQFETYIVCVEMSGRRCKIADDALLFRRVLPRKKARKGMR